MTDDKKMLETICESADMGRDSLKQVIEYTNNDQFKETLVSQMHEYEKIYSSAGSLLQSYGEPVKRANPFAKISAHMTAGFKTLTTDDSTSKIAEMVIEGSTMGVTEMTKQLNNYSGTNKEVEKLAKKHLKTEESNISQIKQFL